MAHLRSPGWCLPKKPEQAKIYCQELQKLETAGYVIRFPQEEVDMEEESLYILHHNEKNRLVFNCFLANSYYQDPPCVLYLLGILLKFIQHTVETYVETSRPCFIKCACYPKTEAFSDSRGGI